MTSSPRWPPAPPDIFLCPDCEFPYSLVEGELCPACDEWRRGRLAELNTAEMEQAARLERLDRRRRRSSERFAEAVADMIKVQERTERSNKQ